MSLENQLGEIVQQLTRIADTMEGKAAHADLPALTKEVAGAQQGKHPGSKPNPGKDAKAKLDTKAKDGVKEPLDTPEPETGHTVEECHKYLFDTLTKIKAHKGIGTAKLVCANFMQQYTGGKPVTVDVIPEGVLDKFYQEVQRVRAQHGIEE